MAFVCLGFAIIIGPQLGVPDGLMDRLLTTIVEKDLNAKDAASAIGPFFKTLLEVIRIAKISLWALLWLTCLNGGIFCANLVIEAKRKRPCES